MTVGELITTYRAAHPTRRPHDDAYFGRWWGTHFGPGPLTDVTTGRIRQAVDLLLAEGRSGSTVAFYVRFLRHVTAWAVSAGHMVTDPCLGIYLPKETTPPLRVITEEEETKLCQALGRPYNLWVRFAILTGLRQSEQFTLVWRSFDLDHGTVVLPHAATGTMMELSLPAEAVTILRTLRQDFPSTVWVFADPKNPLRPADPHNFYVSR